MPHEDHLKEVIGKRLAQMGPMSGREWKLLGLMLVAIVGLLTQKYHGMPGTFVYALIAMAYFLPSRLAPPGIQQIISIPCLPIA